MKSALKYNFLICLSLTGSTVLGQSISDTVLHFPDVLVQKESMSSVIVHDKLDNSLADFSRQEGRRLSDVLNDYSGIYLKNYGVGQLSSISINGSSAAQTNILWNGIKLNNPVTGQVDLALFDVSGSDRISIFTTSQSAIGGSTIGIGGTVALNNDLDLSGANNIRSFNTIRIGSFGERVISTSAIYGTGAFKGATKFGFLSADNDFPFVNNTKIGAPTVGETNAATKQLSFTQQLQYTFRKLYTVGANFWLTDADRQLPPVMSADVSHEREWDQSYRGMAYLSGRKKSFEFSLKSAYLFDHLRYISPSALIDSRSSSEAYRNIFSASYGFRHGISLLGELHYDHETATSTGFDLMHHRDITGMTLALKYFHKTGFNAAISSHGELLGAKPLPLSASLNAGFARQRRKNFVYIYVNGERSFRLPALNDLYWNEGGNPNLRPEKAWKSSVHILYEYSWWFKAIADGYYSYVTDWILWHPTSSGIWMPDNVKRVLSRGATISLNLQSKKDSKDKGFIVSGYASYSFTKTTSLDAVSINDNSQGKQLIYVPLHNLTANIQLQYRHFYIRSMHSYTGERFTTTDNSISLKAYYLTNLEAGKDIYINGQQIGLSFRVNNIANKQYQMVSDRPMPGRNYEATIRLNLAK